MTQFIDWLIKTKMAQFIDWLIKQKRHSLLIGW